MNQTKTDSGPLIKLHSVLWWLLIGWFALVTLLYVVGYEAATFLSAAGIVGILVATLARLVQLGVIFRRQRKTRLLLLAVILIVLLLATGLLRFLAQ